jgi:hypothetical protein
MRLCSAGFISNCFLYRLRMILLVSAASGEFTRYQAYKQVLLTHRLRAGSRHTTGRLKVLDRL